MFVLLLAAIIDESVPIPEPSLKTRLPPADTDEWRTRLDKEREMLRLSIDIIFFTNTSGEIAAVEAPIWDVNVVERAALLAALLEDTIVKADAGIVRTLRYESAKRPRG